MKILITIGHGTIEGGGYNPGACAYGYEEFKIGREVGKWCQAHLNNNYDVKCDLWNYNGDLNLTQRINMLQNNTYDYVAEMHLNAGGGTGTEVYSYRLNDVGGKVAGEICKELSAAFNWRNRGVKLSNGNYGIVDRTVPVSNLVEICFIDKLEDVKKVATADGQLKAGQMIGEGIAKGLGLKKKGQTQPHNPTPQPKPPASNKPSIEYGIKTLHHGIRADVKNGAVAGCLNDAITGIKIGVTSGRIEYRVHLVNKGWLPKVTGANWNDHNNGYAGDGKTSIDAIQIYYYTDTNKTGGKYYTATYTVKPFNKGKYYGDIKDTNWENKDGNNTAGCFGVPFTELKIDLK